MSIPNNPGDLDAPKLSENEMKDLSQFVRNETQKHELQAKIHNMTEICFNKCITGTIRSSQLDKNDEACLANCTNRFFDVAWLTISSFKDWRT